MADRSHAIDDPAGTDAVAGADAAAATAAAALDAFRAVLGARFAGTPPPPLEIALVDDATALARLLLDHRPDGMEFATLMLGLLPHLAPGALERDFAAALGEGDHPEIGMVRDANSRALIPTGQTAAWLLAGEDLAARFAVQRLFGAGHWFAREGILRLEPAAEGAPLLSGRILVAPDWVERLTLGAPQRPAFGPGFPAQPVTTALEWDDLVLAPAVAAQIADLRNWLDYQHTLAHDWGMAGRLRPGYRALFHGPPGTGKTLTATLLGKATGLDVLRVDLSAVVSKYIGETEKNLAALFDRAARFDAILFFDEADALFGKRTAVRDSHDRYANQEVSYLLQRVEAYDGLAILATNLRGNMDDAFLRRFNAILSFPMPGVDDRRAIWERTLPDRGDRVGIARAMAVFELSGGAIANAVQHAAIAALAAGRHAPSLEDAVDGVRHEVEKDGKVFRNLLDDDDYDARSVRGAGQGGLT